MRDKRVYILGSKGWIGSALVREYLSLGYDVFEVHKGNIEEWIISKDHKNIVIYAIGITGDFRKRISETCEAHVGLLNKIIQYQQDKINNFLYFSSSRVYMRSSSTDEESLIKVQPWEQNDIYNISKIMGEALILANKNKNFKVVRISNVLGLNQPNDTFVGQLIKESNDNGESVILQNIDSAKDYISLEDVIYFVRKIISHGNYRVYNIASGKNISHKEIAYWLNKKGYNIKFSSKSSEILKPKIISNKRLISEFREPMNPLDTKLK